MSNARTLLKSVRFTPSNPVGYSGCTLQEPTFKQGARFVYKRNLYG